MQKIRYTQKGKSSNPTTFGLVKGVTLLYTQIQEPHLKHESEDEYEYSVEMVVSPSVADEFEDKFPKNNIRYTPVDWFEDIYKISPDDIDVDTVDSVPTKFKSGTTEGQKAKLGRKVFECFAIIRLKANATVNQGLARSKYGKKLGLTLGDDIPYKMDTRPKVFEPGANGKVTDITMDTLIGNGSLADVVFRVGVVQKRGAFPYIYQILVTDLVEYQASDNNTSFFGDVDEEEPEAGPGFGDFDDEDDEPAPRRSKKRSRLDLTDDEDDEPEEKPARRTRKRKPDLTENDDFADDEPEEKPARKTRKSKAQPEPEVDEDDFEGFEDDEPEEKPARKTRKRKPEPEVDEDEDDFEGFEDEEPAKKEVKPRRRKAKEPEPEEDDFDFDEDDDVPY